MITVHALWGGLPLCLFSEDIPKNWPKGHVWHPTTEWPPSKAELEQKRSELCSECNKLAKKAIFRS